MKTSNLQRAERCVQTLATELNLRPLVLRIHPDQLSGPVEWRGADVRITSDFRPEAPKSFMDHDLIVRTQHAKVLSWLFLELRDAFEAFLDAGNKYGFYGALAQSALRHMAAHQPESDDPRPLLRAVLAAADDQLKLIARFGGIPDNAAAVLHSTDAEGRQSRIDLETGHEEGELLAVPVQPEPNLYFAYGSNMDERTLKDRCPSARFVAVAELLEHALMFTRYSVTRRCGVADVVPSPGRSVWGVLFHVSDADIRRLDLCEGYKPSRADADNAYIRTTRSVYVNGDRECPERAWVYLANRQPNPPPPNAVYKKLITEGARRWGLPAHYQAELARIETKEP